MADLRLVVGVDGSVEAREAVRWACRLTGVLGGEIVAVHALGMMERLHGEMVVAHRRRAEIERVVEEEWCAPRPPDGTPLRTEVRAGHPVDVLLQVAREERADLTVLGTRGGGSAPELALGSTSLHVLRAAEVPILVVPGREASAPHLGLRRIVVALDEMGSSATAADIACGLASAFGSWITVVEAVGSLAEGSEERIGPEIRSRIERSGVPVHVAVRRGSPPEVVRGLATSIDADLVVAGRRHHRDDAGLLAGSTSRQLVRAVRRPALVVPEEVPPGPLGAQRSAREEAVSGGVAASGSA